MPNIFRYQKRGEWYWAIDVWVKKRSGHERYRERDIPTKEQAKARLAKALSDAYEGRAFEINKASTLTVKEAWELYQPVSERDNDSWRADVSRTKHLVPHLGKRVCATLTQEDVDAYRAVRAKEPVWRGGRAPLPPPVKRGEKPPPPPPPKFPSHGTLNRELETLKRIINYAVACGRLQFNPIARAPKLQEAPPRSTVLEDEIFEQLLAIARQTKRWSYVEAILLVAFDTGMRKGEVLNLRREQIDWSTGVVRLGEADTKTNKARVVALQARTLAALKTVPVVMVMGQDKKLHASPFVFANPRTGAARVEFRRVWRLILAKAGLGDVWIHDLRHSFCTLARRRGIAESVVMQSSGHRTRAVFDRYNLVDESDARELAKVMEVARQAAALQRERVPTGEKPPPEQP